MTQRRECPWQIPPTWSWVLAGEITDVVGGGTPRTDDPRLWEGGDIPWITPADLSRHTAVRISKGERSITAAGLTESAARMLPQGTVLMSSRAPVGYAVIAAGPLCTNQGFKSFLPTPALLPDFLYYFIVGNRALLLRYASGTTFQEISGRNAAKIPVPVAPLDEQRRIVAAIEEHLSRLDAAVAALKRALMLLGSVQFDAGTSLVRTARLRQSILKRAFEGRLAPQDLGGESASVLLERVRLARSIGVRPKTTTRSRT